MLGPKCAVCAHPALPQIDSTIVANRATHAQIAQVYKINLHAVRRHARLHVPPILAHAGAVVEAARGQSLRDKCKWLYDQATAGILEAQKAVRVIEDKNGKLKPVGRDLAPLAPLISAGVRAAELGGRASGELQESGQGVTIHQAVILMPRRPELPPAASGTTLGPATDQPESAQRAPASNLGENSQEPAGDSNP